jgi:hypothetical protein
LSYPPLGDQIASHGMSIIGYKRTVLGLSVACAALAVLCGWLYFQHGLLSLRVAFAFSQIEIIDEMRTQALKSTPRDAVAKLDYAVNYYPSGTKQTVGSRLDRLVEAARNRALRDIIGYLRQTTGENLGDDPEPWVKMYGTQ